jgi:hypothetical protein
MIFGILAVMAEFEREMISERTIAGMGASGVPWSDRRLDRAQMPRNRGLVAQHAIQRLLHRLETLAVVGAGFLDPPETLP